MKDKVRIYVRVALVTLLVGLLLYSFFGEKQPYNDGLGWDGRLYYQMCNHSIHDITHHGYSTYYVQRFLPFTFVNAFQMVFGYEHTMFFMMLMLFVATMLGVWGFFKTSNHIKLNVLIETIAFAFIFFNLRVLRCGYSPFYTDIFALSVGIWFFYFFLKKQKWPMMAVAFVSAFIWQSVWPLACVLFILPWDKCDIMQSGKVSTIGFKITEVLKYSLLALPILSLLYLIKICVKYEVPLDECYRVVPYFYSKTSIFNICLATVSFMGYMAYLVYPIHFDIFDLVKNLFRSLKIRDVVIAFTLFVGMYSLVYWVGNSAIEEPIALLPTIRRILWEPLTYPLKFLEGHLLQYGMVIIFFLIYYKQILQVVQNHSCGYLFCMVYILTLGSQTEVRFIVNMLPFLVFAIASVMNELDMRKWVAPVIVGVQLILSHFWYHINSPELLATTITEDDYTYLQYPIQRIFEFSGGPWQSPENYYKWMGIFVVLFLTIYICHRKKWLYSQDRNITHS